MCNGESASRRSHINILSNGKKTCVRTQPVDKKLYLTRDVVDSDSVPENLKLPKPAPEPERPKQPTGRGG